MRSISHRFESWKYKNLCADRLLQISFGAIGFTLLIYGEQNPNAYLTKVVLPVVRSAIEPSWILSGFGLLITALAVSSILIVTVKHKWLMGNVVSMARGISDSIFSLGSDIIRGTYALSAGIFIAYFYLQVNTSGIQNAKAMVIPVVSAVFIVIIGVLVDALRENYARLTEAYESEKNTKAIWLYTIFVFAASGWSIYSIREIIR